MSLLDNRESFKKLDTEDVFGSIGSMDKQITHGWEQSESLELPKRFENAENVCVVGMGGSALGSDFISAAFGGTLSVPIYIVNDYTIPTWVGKNTLVILSSYSGNTEEVVAAAEEVLGKTDLVAVVTSGGKLGDWAEKNSIPAVVIDPKHNPSGQPRIGIGYGIVGQMVILAKAGLLSVTKEDVQSMALQMKRSHAEYGDAAEEDKNKAKQLAQNIKESLVVLMTAEHTTGAGHIFQNQLHETSKQLAVNFKLPELNHHLLEGMSHPKAVIEKMVCVLVSSELYNKRNQKRIEVTKEVLEKQDICTEVFVPMGKTALEQAVDVVMFASYTTFYLAMLNNINPAEIPWVDYFKEQMK